MLPKNTLLQLRVWVFLISTLYHLPISFYLIGMDFTKAEDPRLWFYSYNKFNLFTCWYNGMLVLYYPVSCYCDWRSLRKEGTWPHVELLNKIRDFSFITLVFPSVTLGGTLFWRIWLYDRELLCPTTMDDFVPPWVHYMIHTFSIAVVIFELKYVPRLRPKDERSHKNVALGFICFYLALCFVYWLFGLNVYSLMATLSNFQLFLLCVDIVIEYMLGYYAQWYLTGWLSKGTVKLTGRAKKAN